VFVDFFRIDFEFIDNFFRRIEAEIISCYCTQYPPDFRQPVGQLPSSSMGIASRSDPLSCLQ
jgi:hypothetical protein